MSIYLTYYVRILRVNFLFISIELTRVPIIKLFYLLYITFFSLPSTINLNVIEICFPISEKWVRFCEGDRELGLVTFDHFPLARPSSVDFGVVPLPRNYFEYTFGIVSAATKAASLFEHSNVWLISRVKRYVNFTVHLFRRRRRRRRLTMCTMEAAFQNERLLPSRYEHKAGKFSINLFEQRKLKTRLTKGSRKKDVE